MKVRERRNSRAHKILSQSRFKELLQHYTNHIQDPTQISGIDVPRDFYIEDFSKLIILEVVCFFTEPYDENEELKKSREEGFIPGAISIHPCYIESYHNTKKYYPHYDSSEDGNILPMPQLRHALKEIGINQESTVIVYGKGVVSTMISCRVIWALMSAGVEDVRLLNGGFGCWKSSLGEISSTPKVPVALEHFGGFNDQDNNLYDTPFGITTNDLKQLIKSENKFIYANTKDNIDTTNSNKMKNTNWLADIRSSGEFDGTFKDNYPFFDKSGHIPSAKVQYIGDWFDLALPESQLLKDLDDVKNQWTKLGLDTSGEQTLIFYCGTGWRSSISFFLAYLMGLDAKNYDDGFYGWTFAELPFCTSKDCFSKCSHCSLLK